MRYKRSTARVILLGAAMVAMLCGVIVTSQNLTPFHESLSAEWYLARLRFCVGLSGLGLFVLGLGVVNFLQSRDDRSGNN